MKAGVFVCCLSSDNKQWMRELENDLGSHPIDVTWVRVEKGDIARSRRIGFSMLSHEYVGYVDSDDRIPEGVFQSMIDVLDSDPTIPAVFTGESIVSENLTKIKPDRIHKGFSFKSLISNVQYAHSVCLYRRAILEKIIDSVHPSTITPDWETAVLISSYARDNGLNDPIMLPIIGRQWRQRTGSACKRGMTDSDNILRFKLFLDHYASRPERYEGSDIGKEPKEVFCSMFNLKPFVYDVLKQSNLLIS